MNKTILIGNAHLNFYLIFNSLGYLRDSIFRWDAPDPTAIDR